MKAKKIMAFLICALALISCEGNATGDATSERSTTDESKTVETAGQALATEAELGIVHPLRFADDIKIYDAKDRLTEKQYEIPTKIGENRFLTVGSILAKGKLSAFVYKAEHPDAWPDTQMDMVAIGYYDLEKGAFVPVRDVDQPPYPTLEEVQSTHINPLDETRLVLDVYTPESIDYYVYTMADGKLEKLTGFPHTEEGWFAGIPYVTRGYLYLPEAMANGGTRTHIYDRKTLKEGKISEAGDELRLYKGGEVYRKGGPSGEDNWTNELWIGDGGFKWESAKHEWLLGFGITAEPEAVYTLSQYLESKELEEDLTEADRKNGAEFAPYHVVREMPAGKVIARLRGDYLDMSVGDEWIAFWKGDYIDENIEKKAYIYIPGEKTALRIDFPRPCNLLLLSPVEPYAVLYADQNDMTENVTVFAYEPRAEK